MLVTFRLFRQKQHPLSRLDYPKADEIIDCEENLIDRKYIDEIKPREQGTTPGP
jgi:hypothetical protein